MHADDIRRVRDSLAAIGDAQAFGRLFYAHLFRLRPQARALFPSGLDGQVTKLMDMLAGLIAMLHANGRVAAELAELGRRHAGYGVCEDDYDDVGAALLMALREHIGPAFTPELEQAWATLYADIAEAMIAAEHAAGVP